MLKGFEEQTKDLNNAEKAQGRIVFRLLLSEFEKGRTITNKEICDHVKEKTGEPISGPRMRKIINWLHVNGHLKGLIATNNGYGKAKDAEELLSYVESLEGRIQAIQQRADAVQRDIILYRTKTSQMKLGEL